MLNLYVSLRRVIRKTRASVCVCVFFLIFEFWRVKVASVDNPQGSKIYNLGNGSPVTLRNFISEIEKVCRLKTAYVFILF